MKRLLLGLGVVLISAYGWLAWVGVEPQDRRPGTRLAGQVQPLPQDWGFLTDVQEVHLETQPWYGVPFSVTTVIASGDGRLFVPSIYTEVMAFPGTKYWNRIVAANPDVRLRVRDDLYELRIAPVREGAPFEAALAVLAAKYPFWRDKQSVPVAERTFALLELTPR